MQFRVLWFAKNICKFLLAMQKKMYVVSLSNISENNSPCETKVLLMIFVNGKYILFILEHTIKTWSAVLETMGVCLPKSCCEWKTLNVNWC